MLGIPVYVSSLAVRVSVLVLIAPTVARLATLPPPVGRGIPPRQQFRDRRRLALQIFCSCTFRSGHSRGLRGLLATGLFLAGAAGSVALFGSATHRYTEKYIQDLLARAALGDERTVDTPMELNVKLRPTDDFGVSVTTPTPLLSDSTGAISIARDPVKHELTKHIGVDAFYTRAQAASTTMAYTFRIHCRASDDYSLAIVDGDLWHKDVRYGSGIKDEAGNPAFALVNKDTGEALKHSFGHCLPVRAIKFDPGYLDESVLWAEKVLPDGFRIIHMVNNMDYLFDAEQAIPQYGGARDGTRLILFRWNGGKNQMWQIAHNRPDQDPPLRISCKSNQELSLAVRDGTALLTRTEHEDDTQLWIQSFRNTGHVTDKEGHRSFALVNTATRKALRRSRGKQSVQVVDYSPDSVDVALLWTLSDDLGEGFHCIRSVSHLGFVLDAAEGKPESGGTHNGTPVILFESHGGQNQKWKMMPFH
ncbi:hypothetical protein QYE76_068248 [Lolium multiflorum]|uniref:Ricin B lectin domain-containing protein n=1 Tax=Lolium multiflorum TaxID=4521 RepID=A0AAD8SFX3_LOLMU|nr:hypothetical protein QYE76_068248 [Lolium multiflorum]